MTDTHWTAAPVAKELNIKTKTVHLWASDYEDFLSSGANPGKGKKRTFTPRDLEVLRFIAEERDNDTPHQDIPNMLKSQFLFWESNDYLFEFPPKPGQRVNNEDIGLVAQLGQVREALALAQRQVVILEGRLAETEAQLDDYRERAHRAEAKLEDRPQTNKELYKEIGALEREVELLQEEIAVLRNTDGDSTSLSLRD